MVRLGGGERWGWHTPGGSIMNWWSIGRGWWAAGAPQPQAGPHGAQHLGLPESGLGASE